MSAVDGAQRAARLTDPVGHGCEMLGMVGGAILGAVVGASLIADGVMTGGVSIAVVAVVVAGGGLAGGQLLDGKKRGMSHPTTGNIAKVPVMFLSAVYLWRARGLISRMNVTGG